MYDKNEINQALNDYHNSLFQTVLAIISKMDRSVMLSYCGSVAVYYESHFF